MPGMNSGLNINDPIVVAAFKSALLHQGRIALLIFARLGLAWVCVREWLPAGSSGEAGRAAGAGSLRMAEPAGNTSRWTLSPPLSVDHATCRQQPSVTTARWA